MTMALFHMMIAPFCPYLIHTLKIAIWVGQVGYFVATEKTVKKLAALVLLT
jgi:hypothetical protein